MAVKYYCDDWPTNSAKLAFENTVFTKTQKTNARTEGMTHTVYKSRTDSFFFPLSLRFLKSKINLICGTHNALGSIVFFLTTKSCLTLS